MGKLAIISDLHVDINHFSEADLTQILNWCVQEKISHLHFAGDLANKLQTALAVVTFFDAKIPTTFHWGNHEMADIDKLADFEHFADPRFLNFKTIELSKEKVLLGVNGWYDYRFSDLTDELEIVHLKNLFWYDRMIKRPGTDPEISAAICRQLVSTLAKIPSQTEIILSTHFVPKAEFIVQQAGKYARWNHLNAFLGSPAFGQVIDAFPNVTDVIFGHTHRRFNTQTIMGTRFHCQPFGYYYEWQLSRNFVSDRKLSESVEPTKLRGILKRQGPTFENYRDKHLLEEVKQAITIIAY